MCIEARLINEPLYNQNSQRKKKIQLVERNKCDESFDDYLVLEKSCYLFDTFILSSICQHKKSEESV
jgi:hypothetical protein